MKAGSLLKEAKTFNSSFSAPITTRLSPPALRGTLSYQVMRRDCLKIWNALLNCITAHHPIVADESPAIRNCCPLKCSSLAGVCPGGTTNSVVVSSWRRGNCHLGLCWGLGRAPGCSDLPRPSR